MLGDLRVVTLTGRDILAYIEALYDGVNDPEVREISQVQNMKKYLNYVALGVEPSGQFLHSIRRVMSRAELSRVCAEYLDHGDPVMHEALQEK